MGGMEQPGLAQDIILTKLYRLYSRRVYGTLKRCFRWL